MPVVEETPGKVLKRIWRASVLPYEPGVAVEWDRVAATFLSEALRWDWGESARETCPFCGEYSIPANCARALEAAKVDE